MSGCQEQVLALINGDVSYSKNTKNPSLFLKSQKIQTFSPAPGATPFPKPYFSVSWEEFTQHKKWFEISLIRSWIFPLKLFESIDKYGQPDKPQQRRAQESSPAACQRLCEGTVCMGRGVLLPFLTVFVHF